MAQDITSIMSASAGFALGATVMVSAQLGNASSTLGYEPYQIDMTLVQGTTATAANNSGYYYHITSRRNTSPSASRIVASAAIVSIAGARVLAGGYASTWVSVPTTT